MFNQEGPRAEKRSKMIATPPAVEDTRKGSWWDTRNKITISTAKGRVAETIPQEKFFLFPLSLLGGGGGQINKTLPKMP